jgi:hypothetical protein
MRAKIAETRSREGEHQARGVDEIGHVTLQARHDVRSALMFEKHRGLRYGVALQHV